VVKTISKDGERFIALSQGRNKKDAAALMHQDIQLSIRMKDQRRVPIRGSVPGASKGARVISTTYFCIVIRAVTNAAPLPFTFLGCNKVTSTSTGTRQYTCLEIHFMFRTPLGYHIDSF